MATGLKRFHNDFRVGQNLVTPDEMDENQIYTVINPSINASWFGTAVGTSTQSPTFGLINKIADYPRNIAYRINTASGSTGGGTIKVTGVDQFGSALSEQCGFVAAANGGTTIGTAVFSKVTAIVGTLTTMNAGNGTMNVGVGTGGTTTVFGFPTKLAGSADIKAFRGSFTGVGTQTSGTFVFGGTPSSAYVSAQQGFKAPLDLQAGTIVYQVVYRPTYNAEYDLTNLANL